MFTTGNKKQRTASGSDPRKWKRKFPCLLGKPCRVTEAHTNHCLSQEREREKTEANEGISVRRSLTPGIRPTHPPEMGEPRSGWPLSGLLKVWESQEGVTSTGQAYLCSLTLEPACGCHPKTRTSPSNLMGGTFSRGLSLGPCRHRRNVVSRLHLSKAQGLNCTGYQLCLVWRGKAKW